ncbi:unnamed protein product [Cunninghamella blakesleeana]
MSEYGTLPITNPPTSTLSPPEGEEHSTRASWRIHLGELLESNKIHWTILGLTLVDTIAVMIQLLYTFFHECQVPDLDLYNNEYIISTFLSTTVIGRTISEAWLCAFEIAEFVSISITCLFLLECILSFVAFGPRFYLPGTEHYKLHIFDVIVVVSTFVLEVVLRGKDREVAGLLIMFRLWRVVKIMDAVVKGLTYSNEEELDRLQEEIEHLKATNAALEKENQVLKTQIEKN